MTGKTSEHFGPLSRVGPTKKENFSMLAIIWRSMKAMLTLRLRRFIYHVQDIGTTEDGDENYVLDLCWHHTKAASLWLFCIIMAGWDEGQFIASSCMSGRFPGALTRWALIKMSV
jgi:hypothetical protein